jgi:DNA-directed RNA polymerase beta' subunit
MHGWDGRVPRPLARLMFHIGFIKTVLSIMRYVHFICSKILADEVSLGFTQEVCFLFTRIY